MKFSRQIGHPIICKLLAFQHIYSKQAVVAMWICITKEIYFHSSFFMQKLHLNVVWLENASYASCKKEKRLTECVWLWSRLNSSLFMPSNLSVPFHVQVEKHCYCSQKQLLWMLISHSLFPQILLTSSSHSNVCV